MKLNKLESAWTKFKLLNSMEYIDSKELLAIIENPESMKRAKLQRLVLNMIMFLVLTIVCQSG